MFPTIVLQLSITRKCVITDKLNWIDPKYMPFLAKQIVSVRTRGTLYLQWWAEFLSIPSLYTHSTFSCKTLSSYFCTMVIHIHCFGDWFSYGSGWPLRQLRLCLSSWFPCVCLQITRITRPGHSAQQGFPYFRILLSASYTERLHAINQVCWHSGGRSRRTKN